jgi:hypothetical protein
MKSTLKTLMSAVAGLGILTSFATDAGACGGRGGGGWGGGGFRQNYNYNYQQYPQQYQQYPQQQLPPQQYQQVPQQQVQQQFPQQQQQFPQQQVQQQPGQPQQFQQAPQQPQLQQQQGQQQQFSQQQGMPQQGVQGQGVPQGQAMQGQGAPVARNVAAGGPQVRTVAKPVSTGGANVIAQNNGAPVAAAPQQAPIQPAQGSAEMSALQALGGWDGSEQPAEATSQGGFSPTGEFSAALPNGATVRLRMLEDSTFIWTATNKGKDSSFQGTYTIEGSSLKLLRSNDNVKLEGAFGQSQNGFTFKLGSGQTETNMSFVRN